MAEEPVYSLLQSIDPTKIKVPISERFSKLTLSSNKKQPKREQEDEDEDRYLLPVRVKRESATRNLLEQLSQQSSSSSSELQHKNPLLRSESSKDQSNERDLSHLGDNYETMDALNVTDDDDEDDDDNSDTQAEESPNLDVDALSQKISTLSMIARPISVSSSCSSVGPPHEATQLVSTESQRSSMGEVRPFHNIIEVPVHKYKKEVVSLTSANIQHIAGGQSYEMTEDDESDDNEAITISDSSEEGEAEMPEENAGEMAMSTMNTARETLNLPVLSPEKMERVAAFLRDVSMEQRNLEENGHFSMEELVYNENCTPQKIETTAKARTIASADTESMTPDGQDEEEATAVSLLERQMRLKAFGVSENLTSNEPQDSTMQTKNQDEHEDNVRRLANDETQDNSIMTDLQVSPSQHYNIEYIDKTPQNTARRFVSAETQDNTILDDQEEIAGNSDKSPNKAESPKEQARRLVSAETQENTIISERQLNSPTPPSRAPKTPSREDHRRLALDETEENTKLNFSTSLSEDKDEGRARRLAHDELKLDDTEENTNLNLSTSLSEEKDEGRAHDETEVNTSLSALSSPDMKKPLRNLAEDETELNSSHSVPSSPEMKTPRKNQNIQDSYGSVNSLISSSPIQTGGESAPEHSITILETDDAESECDRSRQSLRKSQKCNDNNKLSNSFHNDGDEVGDDDDDDDSDMHMSQIQMSMANINISAKINIKIHIPMSTETSEDGDSSDHRRSTIDSLPESRETRGDYKQTPSKGNRKEIISLESSPDEHQYRDTFRRHSKQTPSKANKQIISVESTPDQSLRRQTFRRHCIESPLKANKEILLVESSPDQSLRRETIRRHGKQTPSQGNKQTRTLVSSPNNSPNNGKDHSKHDESLSAFDKSTNNVEEDEQFVNVAQKLLNQLYGNSWQTPDVIRTLKRSSDSGEKNTTNSKDVKSSTKKRQQQDKALKAAVKNQSSNKLVEDSILGDFSMFRRNIVNTNLDSTRLVTPKPKSGPKTKTNCYTEPRNSRKQPPTRVERERQFIKPQTEVRRQRMRTPAVAKISAGQVRSQNNRWRQLVNDDDASDFEGNNASDDDDADKSDDDFEVSAGKTQGKSSKTITNNEVVSTKNMKTKKVNKYKDDSSDDDDNDDHQSDASWKKSEGESSDTDVDLPNSKPPARRTNKGGKKKTNNSQDDLVYLDLSKEEVSIQELVPESPPANHDVSFASRLKDLLQTCQHEDKPKLPSSAQSTKSKRKLFTPMFGDDLEGNNAIGPENVEKENRRILADENESIILDSITCPFDAQGRPKKLEIFNKQLELVKVGKPIFNLTPSPKKPATPLKARQEKNNETPSSTKIKPESKTKSVRKGEPKCKEDLCETPNYKYSFLKSFDVTVSKAFCHPDALYYRDNYRTKKEVLSTVLYEIYNEKLFSNKLDLPITWNKKLSNTAGRCLNKKKFGNRSSVIELSDKVLTSADRLRCTLIHELCHAATWIFNGEGGHGRTWKDWASRANATFPELPKIEVCHQYDIEYKYTYKCTLCAAKSYAHSKSKKVENIRCSYCHGAIEIFINKKDKAGNLIPTPVREPTGFAKFVKDNYKKYKREDTKHADVMKILSNEFASMKLTKNGN